MEVLKREIRIFIASPSDVLDERQMAEEIVNELNTGIANAKQLTLTAVTGSHFASKIEERTMQVVLDEIDMGKINIFVGIMWKRFGTPTGDLYESGTEEEFYAAYNQWKVKGKPRIMFYFNTQPVMPSIKEIKQLEKVLAFKEMMGKKGLLGEYNGAEKFKDIFRKHLTDVLLSWDNEGEKELPTPLWEKYQYFDTWRDAFAQDRLGGERVESFLYKSAKNIVKFMTISGRSVYSGDVEEVLKTKDTDFRFKLLLFDWDSPYFSQKMKDERRASQKEIDLARNKARSVARNFLELSQYININLEIRLYKQYPVWRFMIIDNKIAYIGYYPKDKRGYEGPMFIHNSEESGSLFYPMNQYFDKLWEESLPALTLDDHRLKK
jgi:hypothetical protein